jgi:hypothetical protein
MTAGRSGSLRRVPVTQRRQIRGGAEGNRSRCRGPRDCAKLSSVSLANDLMVAAEVATVFSGVLSAAGLFKNFELRPFGDPHAPLTRGNGKFNRRICGGGINHLVPATFNEHEGVTIREHVNGA